MVTFLTNYHRLSLFFRGAERLQHTWELMHRCIKAVISSMYRMIVPGAAITIGKRYSLSSAKQVERARKALPMHIKPGRLIYGI